MSLAEKKCKPCEAGTPPLDEQQENELIEQLKGWHLNRQGKHKISKTFEFPGFLDAVRFVVELGHVAEAEGHHPDIHVYYNKVVVDLWTHKIGGLSENDFVMAAKADQINLAAARP
ncbi:MAG: 4a-hydroxytetrahydrobiopterin dehydratase [Chitinivibrionales bacterium]|nr:4a-hydroxytetrahydrobiopterin dehydratase [Chitinivibrionales bacterium]MBD3356260.1 4a-hydroxytetrahydrobiopterin dehydratase [Chitinivibrionales bacterium]